MTCEHSDCEKACDGIQVLQDEEYCFPYHYVSRFRGGFAQCYNDTWAIHYVSTIEFVLSRLKSEAFQRIADVGCGDGRLTAELVRDFPHSNVLGIDYSERAIGLARALSPQCKYVAANIINDQLGAVFDGAVLMEVFEHIPPELAPRFVAALANLLKPGGFLLVTVPHVNKPVEYKHYRHFSSESLISSFEKHFQAIEILPFEKKCWQLSALKDLLTNRFFILNHARIRNLLYRYYKRSLFLCDERHCQRLFAKFLKSSV